MKHINLTQMLQGCSKRNGMTVRASNPDGEVNRQSRLMSLSGKKAEKEQLSPSCLLSASFPLSFRSRYLRYAAMIFCVLVMSVGQAWAVKSTFTKGETIFIVGDSKTNSAWKDDACVKAWFNVDGEGDTGATASTNWLVGSDDSKNKVFWTIVPAENCNQVQLQRFAQNCSTWWNSNGDVLQSARSNDDYNTLFSNGSGNSNCGWKNMTYSFGLRTDKDSWANDVATFEDKGEGLFQCVYTFTASAKSHEFKIRDCWDNWYGRLSDGNNYVLTGLESGTLYTVVASFNIKDCAGGNKTSLSVFVPHTPGFYTSASGNNQTLTTFDNQKYERYGIYKNSSANTFIANGSSSSPASAQSVFTFNNSTHKSGLWIDAYVSGNTSSGASWGTNEFTGFPTSSTHAVQTKDGYFMQFCVQGYEQFNFFAVDKNTSTGYYVVVIDGKDVTTGQNTTAQKRSYTISGGDTHIIKVGCIGNSGANFWGFSLRPSAPTITASSLSGATYNQGAAAAALSVTVSPVVAGHTPTYQWYKNTTNKNTGGTIIEGATSASYTPSTTSTGTTYYYCVVSEEGCNSKTSDVSGAITVNAVVVPCSATQPGTISKGTASGGTGTITLTAAGEPASNNTWYWQASADGTSTSESGATKNVSAAGTYYIRSYCSDGSGCWSAARSVTVDAADLLTPITPLLTYASTVTYGSTISPTLTGNAGSGTVTYSLNSVSPAGSLTIISSTGVVTGATAGGTATVTATIAAKGNYAGGSATSSTITVTTAALPGTASTGTATSVTHNSASLPFTITDVTGVASITIKVYNGASVAMTYSGITPATSGSYSATGLSASTTYTYTVTLIGDANHNDKAETSKSTSFTTSAEPTLTALVDGTLYKANGIFSGDIPTSDTYVGGISDNGKFFFEGSASASPHNSMKWKEYSVTLNKIEFDAIIYFDGESTLSSNNPTTRAMKFILPSAGTLTIYYRDNNDKAGKVKLNKSGSEPTWSSTTKGNSYATTSELSAGTYYLYATGGSTGIFGVQFDATAATYTVSATVNPAGYGTLSASSITDVTSGTAISASSNVLTVAGKTPITATPASATAQYTYAFNNWTKSDGTALPSTVTAALAVRANFTRSANSYTLAWNTNGGSDLAGDYTSGSTAYGASITAPTDPTLSNYTFDGWKTNNDGTGTTAGATMPAAATTYYAAWKQTVTLKTGAQGSGADQTPYVYINGTGVSSFTAHTATGYTLQGYYTAGSGGVKVLNADGSFAAANVTDYITSSKWSRTGAEPTLYAQWRAAAGKTCYTWDAEETHPQTGTNSYGGLYLTISQKGKYQFNSGGTNDTCFYTSSKGHYIKGHINGTVIDSLKFKASTENGDKTAVVVAFCSTYPYDTAHIIQVNSKDCKVYSVNKYDAAESFIKIKAPTGAKSFAIGRNFETELSVDGTLANSGKRYIYYVEACSAGGGTHTISYNAGGGSGSMSSNTGITDDDSQTLTSNSFTAPTNYSFAGWVADVNVTIGGSTVTAGTLIANGATITNITVDIALTAKWSQSVTLDANTSNHGSGDNGSATAYYNATSLSSVTHTKAATGYKLSGYYTAATSGTKVLNADGSFASANVTDWISSGKWICVASTRTLFAQYESAGALTWNLIVDSDTANLSTSTKTSAFTKISTTNMTDAALTGLTYDKSKKKSSLTGKISTPASYDADKYVKVTFQVASGYKFTPSSIKVIAQPVTTGKDVKLSLTDGAYHSLVSSSATSISGGSTQTVTLAGDGTYFTGTVTLKIYCYGATDAYRLGTPITIEGEIEEACATMPSYTSMSYTTTTFAPNDDASGSPITIVGGDNINTYQWKYNRVNDRTSGTNCGTNNASLTPLTDAGAAIDGTRYYWCEMTNEACGITIKSPAVAITVAAAKSDATVAWTDPASTPNYGGGGYTIKATVDQPDWDGNAADLVITAPAGINIYNVTSGTTSSQKWVQADFDVQTSFDRTTYASNIPFTVSAAATASYNAISNDYNVSYSACAGAGEGSSYNIRMRKTVTKDGNYYHCANTDGWISPNISSSYSTGKAGTKMETDFDTVASSNTQYVWVRTYHANVNKVRIYADFRANDMTVSNVYKHTAYFSADSKYAVDYTAVYNGDEENENTGTAAQGYVDITLDEVMAANDILLVKFNDSKVRPLGAVITEGSAESLNTHLQWSNNLADKATVNKYTTDAYFTYSASKITENTNTLGTITYSSSNTSVATVDATGKVALIAAGSTTIKATLAASGCYKKAEISYTLNVAEVSCTITAGTLTLTSGTESKCSSDKVTLTLTGFESGASIQWKDGDTNIDDGGNYKIESDGTTSTLTTDQEGTYSVMVTSGCSVRSNRITISNKSTEVGAKRIVKNWYIKNGRPTPDIELWTLQNGAHLSSVAWSSTNTTGLTASDFYESDGKVYLKGKEPSSNTSGADIIYTLTLTVEDDCGSTTPMSASGQLIYLHHQQNTDKHVLAFVVNGTDKGGFTEGITSAQTTSVPLYNEIAANFDVLATNIYSTDDEQALKEYYSQFDILCVTDYPNTGTKGVNKKSYVDALGALVDIRPILTMEAFVAKLANWKAKGLSGNPKNPTTRQYTMDLQCKDHEIFSGTELTKVGEGDETMYRVSMVCDTLEDYKTLDATYGAGTHEKDKNYQYGKKPALQGFTFTKEMLDDDLLPLGLIDDGSGNDLQVGIERQRNMEARLMVLGINSYAMERLTDDGQTVVVNALKYLMKKNSEDIADCSNMFVGGDDEEDESTRSDWNVASHWSGNAVPDRTQKVRIVAPCVIKAGEKVHVAGVVIAPGGNYNHGANTANGSLTIAAGGALIVDGKVEAATAPLYTETRPTSPSDLTIQASSTAQGALIFDNDKGETQATVEMYSPSYWEIDKETGKKKKYWSYVAMPITEVPVGEYFYGAFTYLYSETSGWIKKGMYTTLYPFDGIGLSMQDGHKETFRGTLVSTENREITLTHDNTGKNMVGNSWTAPIQIANFDADDFGDATASVLIFNTGNKNEGTVIADDGGSETSTAGQWLTIPISVARLGGYTGLKVIPSMQAFQVNTSTETTLTLDYDKLVRDVNIASDNLTEPHRAPRKAKEEEVDIMRVRVNGENTHTDVWLLEDERFSDEFDNGWEAKYVACDDRSAQLYAVGDPGKMSFIALPDIEGTVLGFAPSRDGNTYQFTFHYIGKEEYYLNDLKLKQSVLISEDKSYSFMYEDGDTNRFYISRTRIDAPQMPTGVDNAHEGTVKAHKFIYNDKLYIMLNGRVYSAEGALVK